MAVDARLAAASLKIHGIPLDKDSWENVPGLVHKAFLTCQQNMTNIRDWARRQEQGLKVNTDKLQVVETQISHVDRSLNTMQDQLQRLTTDLGGLITKTQDEAATFVACLFPLLRAIRAMLAGFGGSFGVAIADGDLDGHSCLEDHKVPSQHDGNAGNESDHDADRAADDADRTNSEADGAQSAAQPEQQRCLEALRNQSVSLEASLGSLDVVFERWGNWRRETDGSTQAMRGTITELSEASSRIRERLLMWREMLKESSQVVDALGTSLSATQVDVRHLQETQVQKRDVDEAVGQSHQELEELQMQTEQRLSEVAQHVDAHMLDVQELIRQASEHTNTRIEEHNKSFMGLLERNLKPVNAYLNNMHVKADAVQVEIDTLKAQVPALDEHIRNVAEHLENSDMEAAHAAAELKARVDGLAVATAEGADERRVLAARLAEEVGGLSGDLGSRIGEVRASLEATTEKLEALRSGDVDENTKNLGILEQKVAQWVHAHPLPAKISEARLYALEARLCGEMDARMALEEHVKANTKTPSRTPRSLEMESSMGLPSLQKLATSPAGPTKSSLAGPHSARRAPPRHVRGLETM